MNKDAEGRWKVGRSYIKLKMRAKEDLLHIRLTSRKQCPSRRAETCRGARSTLPQLVGSLNEPANRNPTGADH